MFSTAKLGVGAVSIFAIRNAYRVSHLTGKQLIIISSRSQIDYDGGYLGITTKNFVDLTKQYKELWPRSEVLLARDHCGPNIKFKDEDISKIRTSIEWDCSCNFDIIHIDFSRAKDLISTSCSLMRDALAINPHIRFEVGKEENDGNLDTMEDILETIDVYKEFPLEFFALRTGSSLSNGKQVGSIRKEEILDSVNYLHGLNIRVKEHNADYSSIEEVMERTNLVDTMNVAPEFGVIQTKKTIELCEKFGIDDSEFLNKAYETQAWKRWAPTSDILTKSVVSGHYVFNTKEYKDLIEKLDSKIDVISEFDSALELAIRKYLCT